jgi:hypothetical protein
MEVLDSPNRNRSKDSRAHRQHFPEGTSRVPVGAHLASTAAAATTVTTAATMATSPEGSVPRARPPHPDSAPALSSPRATGKVTRLRPAPFRINNKAVEVSR